MSQRVVCDECDKALTERRPGAFGQVILAVPVRLAAEGTDGVTQDFCSWLCVAMWTGRKAAAEAPATEATT